MGQPASHRNGGHSRGAWRPTGVRGVGSRGSDLTGCRGGRAACTPGHGVRRESTGVSKPAITNAIKFRLKLICLSPGSSSKESPRIDSRHHSDSAIGQNQKNRNFRRGAGYFLPLSFLPAILAGRTLSVCLLRIAGRVVAGNRWEYSPPPVPRASASARPSPNRTATRHPAENSGTSTLLDRVDVGNEPQAAAGQAARRGGGLQEGYGVKDGGNRRRG